MSQSEEEEASTRPGPSSFANQAYFLRLARRLVVEFPKLEKIRFYTYQKQKYVSVSQHDKEKKKILREVHLFRKDGVSTVRGLYRVDSYRGEFACDD